MTEKEFFKRLADDGLYETEDEKWMIKDLAVMAGAKFDKEIKDNEANIKELRNIHEMAKVLSKMVESLTRRLDNLINDIES